MRQQVLQWTVIACILVGVLSQVSFVPSRMFASCTLTTMADQFKCINVNNANASITISNNSNPYVIALEDIHDNVQSSHVVLGGLTNEHPTESSFEIGIVASTNTQFAFVLNVQGNSIFGQMQFFLLLIGNEATGYIQAHTFTETCNLTSPGPTNNNLNTSISRTVNISLATPYNVEYFLSYFSLTQVQGGTDFEVGINAVGSNATAIEFNYYSDRGCDLTKISLVAVLYNSTTMPLNVTYFGFSTNTYSTDLNNANTGSPTGSYSLGFNRKCLLGFGQLSYSNLEYFQFDINNVPGTPITNFSNPGNNKFNIYCMVESFNCTEIDINCLECISHSKCSLCDSHYYVQEYPNTTASCLLCANAITGCDTCTNTSLCLTCVAPTYQPSGVSCVLCSVYIPNCLNCTDNVTCTGCVDYYGLINSTTCALCSSLMTGCQLCSSNTTCTKCYNGYYLSGTSCLLCNTGVANCAVCLSSTVCTLCYSDSYLGTGNLSCVCNPGKIQVSGLCTVPGCSSAYRFSSTTYCISCNTSLNYYYSSYNCYCNVGYQQLAYSCSVICGDGLVVEEACDDGNVVNGDGCSQTCTVESDYSCVNGSVTSKSVCIYISPITVELIEIVKTVDANTAEITLKVSPNVRPLNKMNFTKYVSLAVNGRNITYTPTYNDDGTLTVLVQYTEDLEGLPATFTLSYDPTLVGLSPAVLTFNMVGHNDPLNYSSLTGLQTIILYFGYFLAGLFVLQLLLSLALHKLIGLQTMQVLQVVFFSRYLLANSGPMGVYNMYSIGYINGYNPFMRYTNVMNLDGSLMRLGLSKNFIFNIIVQVALIAFLWLVSWCYSRKATDLKRRNADSDAVGIKEMARVTANENRAASAAFIVTAYSFFLLCFGLISSIQSKDEVYYQLPRLAVIFTVFAFFYEALYLTGQMFLAWKEKYDEEEGIVNKYLAILIFFQMGLATCIVGLEGLQYALEVLTAVQAIYVVLLIVVKPYLLTAQNVLLVICQCVSLAFCCFLTLINYVSLADSITTYTVLAFEGLLTAVGVIALVRLFYHSKFNEKEFKRLRMEEDKLKGKDVFSKKEYQKQQEMLVANQNNVPTFTQKKQFREQKEKDELALIKARLKVEFKEKKADEEVETIVNDF